jgi:hypothetical protein
MLSSRTFSPWFLLVTFAVLCPSGFSQASADDSKTPSEDLTNLLLVQPIDDLVRETPELQGLEPATTQEDLPSLLQKLGEHVAASFLTFSNTTSIERVKQERLRSNGTVLFGIERESDYVCLVPAGGANLGVEEYRSHSKITHPVSADGKGETFVLTTGFTSTPLVFHPLNQPESTFRYLGRQHLNGHEELVLAYAQRADATRLTCKFRKGDRSVEARTCGIAWADPGTYRISRMQTNLLHAYPAMRLERVTTDIRFADVRFEYQQASLWLPSEVVVMVKWDGKLSRNSHEYSKFQLFTADSTERHRKPHLARSTSRDTD